MAIVKRLIKGSALTHAELDGNFTDLDGRVSTLESASDSDSQTLTLAGTNLSISGGNTVDLSGLDSDTNTYVSSGTFDNATKTITLTKSDATTVPVDISSITVTESQISDFGTYLVDLTEESLGTLADVDLVSNPPTAGQPLVWDEVNTLWKPGAAVELQTLADVTANGATTNDNVILGGTLSITGDVSANADLTVTGAFDAQGPAAFDGLISFNGTVNTGIVFEGVTVDDFETTINATDPTADRTITFPDASGTVALLSDISGGSYNDASVDTHLNTSTATANQILSWDGADYAWVADQTGSGSSASNLIAWDLADAANSKVLDAGTAADSAWYYGDVVSDPANPATSVVLDISAATFTGNVMGEVHGDVKQADGLTLILDVDAGVGTAMYYGDVTGNIITESVQPASSTTLDPGTVLTVKGGSTSAINSIGGDLILDAGSGGAQGGVVKVGTIDGTGVTIGSGTGSIEMNSVTNFNANVDFESGSTVDFTGVTVTGLSGGGGSGLQSRGTVTGTTSSLADAAEADLDITGFKSYALLTITTDRAARVRLYVSDATRLADASRAEGVDPTSDAGLIAEVITTGAETVIISPGAYGFNLESSPTTTIPCRVTNKSGSTSTVQVDLNILQLEA